MSPDLYEWIILFDPMNYIVHGLKVKLKKKTKRSKISETKEATTTMVIHG